MNLKNMNFVEYKETNWRCWAVKGRLCPIHWQSDTLWLIYDEYFKRMWMNEEATYTAKDGFDETFDERIKKYYTLQRYFYTQTIPMHKFFREVKI